MGRLSRSWGLAKASWHTLNADRELLALPVFSFIVSLLVLGVAGGLVFLVDYDPNVGFEDFELSPAGIVLMVVTGLVLAVVATYFQAAMVGGARERLTGRDPSIGSALAVATSRLGVIVPWAIFSWTIGAVLRAIADRVGAVGALVVRTIGLAFRVVTFVAVPVLVVEALGPIATLKRSAHLLKSTWGENLVGQAGIGLVSFVATVPILAIAGVIATTVSPIVAVIVAVPPIAVVAVVTTTLTAVYQTALYQYATTGSVPIGFEGAGLRSAFAPK